LEACHTSYSTNQQANFGYDYLLRLLSMYVFIHFQHFMEDSIASPIELQQVMHVLTNFDIYI